MKSHTRRLSTPVAFAIALALSMTACGDGKSDGDADLTTDSAASTVGSASAVVDSASKVIDSASAVIDAAAPGGSAPAKLNINTASHEELHSIANAGDKMVHEFEEYRPYGSIIKFRKQIGKYVDAKQVAEFEKYIFVPVDINASDAATLQQIPGLDAAEADLLIKGRPYNAKDAFMQALAPLVTHDEALVAATYLSHETN